MKNGKKSKLFKIAWNGEKIGQTQFLEFLTPAPLHKKNGYLEKLFVNHEKSKLSEIAWYEEKIGLSF